MLPSNQPARPGFDRLYCIPLSSLKLFDGKAILALSKASSLPVMLDGSRQDHKMQHEVFARLSQIAAVHPRDNRQARVGQILLQYIGLYRDRACHSKTILPFKNDPAGTQIIILKH
jgi:hypothetical protein